MGVGNYLLFICGSLLFLESQSGVGNSPQGGYAPHVSACQALLCVLLFDLQGCWIVLGAAGSSIRCAADICSVCIANSTLRLLLLSVYLSTACVIGYSGWGQLCLRFLRVRFHLLLSVAFRGGVCGFQGSRGSA